MHAEYTLSPNGLTIRLVNGDDDSEKTKTHVYVSISQYFMVESLDNENK